MFIVGIILEDIHCLLILTINYILLQILILSRILRLRRLRKLISFHPNWAFTTRSFKNIKAIIQLTLVKRVSPLQFPCSFHKIPILLLRLFFADEDWFDAVRVDGGFKWGGHFLTGGVGCRAELEQSVRGALLIVVSGMGLVPSISDCARLLEWSNWFD